MRALVPSGAKASALSAASIASQPPHIIRYDHGAGTYAYHDDKGAGTATMILYLSTPGAGETHFPRTLPRAAWLH